MVLTADFPAVVFVPVVSQAVAVALEHVVEPVVGFALDVAALVLADVPAPHLAVRLAGAQLLFAVAPIAASALDVAAGVLADVRGQHFAGQLVGALPPVAAAVSRGPLLAWPAVAAAPANAGAQEQSSRWPVMPAFAVRECHWGELRSARRPVQCRAAVLVDFQVAPRPPCGRY